MLQKPKAVQIGITEKCNLSCLHCDIWKKERQPDLSIDQWREIIVKLKDWLGPYRVDISGGEPFIRKELMEIIRVCNSQKILVVVTTNATLLTKEMIDELSGMNNLTLNISLDGANQQTHDYLRNTPGVYQRVMEVLQCFKFNHKKCHITLAVILMGYNLGQIKDIIKLASVEKLADGVCFQALDNNFGLAYDPTWYFHNKLWNQEDKVIFSKLIDDLVHFKKTGLPIYNPIQQLEQFKNYFNHIDETLKKDCALGFSNFIVNPYGKVQLCWNMDPIGDICQENPEVIWGSSLARIRRVQIKKCQRTCRILNCNSLSEYA